MAPYANAIQEYYCRIRSGEIIVGKWIKTLYEKITSDLRDGKIHYDDRKANKAIDFIENFCHHCEGRNDLLKLELWQKAAVSVIFGIVDENGFRQYREIFMVVGRKNGKSILAAAILAYAVFLDGEYGAKCYVIAPKLDQASVVYSDFRNIVYSDPELSSLVTKKRENLYIESTNTEIRMLAFSSKKSDGFNPHVGIFDEMAAFPAEQGKKQYEVITSAIGARRQPIILSISSGGYVTDGPYDELYTRSTAWLMGNSSETHLVAFLYIIDDLTKWDDLDELKKSNPNMGVSVSPQFFLDEIAIAKVSVSKRIEFIVKYCNVKQNSTEAWIPYEIVERNCGEELKISDFAHSYAVGGIDLSQTTDLTSACVVIQRDGKLYVFSHFWMPEAKIDELAERDSVPYRIYQKKGWLSPSGENFVDYEDVHQWFFNLYNSYEIIPLKIGYDRFSAQYLVKELAADGFHMDDVYQGFNLTPVMNEVDGMLRDGSFNIGNNSLLKSHFLNTACKIDKEQRKMMPVKIEARAHIDGFMAFMDAMTVRQKYYDEIGELLKNE